MRMLESPKRIRRRMMGGRPGRRPDPETPARIERRRLALVPLFAYMKRHHINVQGVVRDACALVGVEPLKYSRVYHIQIGTCHTPEWFVEACCRAMGRTVEEVMGSGWDRGRAA